LETSRLSALDEARLGSQGFRRVSRARLEHEASGVRVDLLISRDPVPRRAGATYPGPLDVEASESDPDFVGLAPLLHLTLLAGRYQERADVVALLKRVDDAHDLPLEAAMPPALRSELAGLRRDALEEPRTTSDRRNVFASAAAWPAAQSDETVGCPPAIHA
jgi:hypothetical protein